MLLIRWQNRLWYYRMHSNSPADMIETSLKNNFSSYEIGITWRCMSRKTIFLRCCSRVMARTFIPWKTCCLRTIFVTLAFPCTKNISTQYFVLLARWNLFSHYENILIFYFVNAWWKQKTLYDTFHHCL